MAASRYDISKIQSDEMKALIPQELRVPVLAGAVSGRSGRRKAAECVVLNTEGMKRGREGRETRGPLLFGVELGPPLKKGGSRSRVNWLVRLVYNSSRCTM